MTHDTTPPKDTTIAANLYADYTHNYYTITPMLKIKIDRMHIARHRIPKTGTALYIFADNSKLKLHDNAVLELV